ncbi:MAG: phosphoenolpyruvate--protein phosphotransferase [Candidatus Brocadia sp.]|jgi:Phosphotransferase System HPr (HPr) Family/phosphoenolpyruvate-protein phosphotransferase|uniref:Phosphoenolpyruvate-protein phosphotransferase n=1 Tax=Candidatus Brocadia fulgida TaxID=380242 RepID=A0A0M2UU20_9BACT|nr:MAG: phosphoenolpyruvate-protein phosphotransferase [Candidatus Brocadia fulgida]MCC6326424.1 phosphoenolpyruvate--protein phosphotransferase [Candidatus Brocadia sp.]MCE7911694.1 phosphoenolpyruvate--protein phosphotransferase [Candidatus Brocadia sp. AMX3]MBV6519036.1 Phosphoenolpyruvate-protein phosphotransferase [Candidatus Brocadia fulgida]MDG5995675.1 phosphoenolpyruvate--protein phosphotransferase [Candidatus Brocadia sp.]
MDIYANNSQLLERKVKISNSNGMHARPATKFAEIANKYTSEIRIKTKNKEVDGKSIIELLTLGAENGTEIIISAKGTDAAEVLDALEGLVKNKFEEEFMEIRKGIAVSPGVVIRGAFMFESEGYRIPRHLIGKDEVEAELMRLEKAIEDSKREIHDLEQKVSENMSSEIGSIFGTHRMVLQDVRLKNEIVDKIKKANFTPEFAVSLALRVYIRKFQDIRDSYLADRVSDIFDIERRLLKNLLGEKREELKNLAEEVVLVAHDLTPSQTASLDTGKVKGFATDAGGRTSHTAIVARALGIPAVVGLGTITSDVFGGDTVIVDGNSGIVIVRPNEETLAAYQSRVKSIHVFEERLATELKDQPSTTGDGKHISIFGNIEFPKEININVRYGAEGIGLYRTEFLYLGAPKPPTEEEHFEAYATVVQELQDKPVIIRTLDLGADKFDYLDNRKEGNPFLGCRSIRYCFENPSIFKIQLRAILRASALGNVKILFPLISSLQELQRAKQMVWETMEELDKESVSFNKDIDMGVMLEVPSAVIIADLLAKECDFFSIGTNDLIQYSLAVDRNNERVAYLYCPVHPAILRLLKTAIKAAADNNIPIGICGQMGSEIEYIAPLIGMGLTEFSVAPATIIPEIKKIVRSITFQKAKEIAETTCQFEDPEKTIKYLRSIAINILPEVFDGQNYP